LPKLAETLHLPANVANVPQCQGGEVAAAKKAKDQLMVLAKAGCGVSISGRTPFLSVRDRGGSSRLTVPFWEAFGFGKDERSAWLTFKDGEAYGAPLQKTALLIVKILENDFAASERSRTKEGTNVGAILDDVHHLWDHGFSDLRDECIELVKHIHYQRIEANKSPNPPSPPPPEINLPLTHGAMLLALPESSVPVSLEGRRNLFLKPPDWGNICSNGYCKRPILRQITDNATKFLTDALQCSIDFKMPLFWIGGRSGDGKSILLQQAVRNLLSSAPGTTFLHFGDPEQMLAWLQENQGALANAGDRTNAQTVLVLDDLHKCPDWDAAREILDKVATRRKAIAVMTCGPTPERTRFIAAMPGISALTVSDAEMIGVADLEVFASHLELDLVQFGDNQAPTLVEALFLARQEDSLTLAAFAERLRDRVDGIPDQAGLLQKLIVMTMLDLDLPQGQLDQVGQDWLNELAAETQLHVGTSDQGYRFGHPAIAVALFDALTRNPKFPVSVEQRITDVLLPVLQANFPRDRLAQVLRQIETRAKEVSASADKILHTLFEQASSPTARQAVTIYLLNKAYRNNGSAAAEFVNTARAARDAVTTDPGFRGELAARLAVLKNASQGDRAKAIDLLADANVGSHMRLFVRWLVTKDATALRKSKHTQIKAWAISHCNETASQAILGKYLSDDVPDMTVRSLVRRHLEKAGLDAINPTYMSAIAKHAQNPFRPEIEEWLGVHSQSHATAGILAALLSKPGSQWQDHAFRFFDQLVLDDSDLFKALEHLLPHIDFQAVTDIHLAASVEQKIADLLDKAAENRDADGLFLTLAGTDDPTYNDRLGQRIDFLQRSEVGAYPQICDLVAKAWPKLEATHPNLSVLVGEILAKVPDALQASTGEKAPKEVKAILAAAEEILRTGRASVLANLDCLLKLFEILPPGNVFRGLVAGRLLNTLMQPAKLVGLAVSDEQIRHIRADLRAEAWLHADAAVDTKRKSASICGTALIDTMTDDELPQMQAWIEAKFSDELQHDHIAVLTRWLRNERSRAHGVALLSNDSKQYGKSLRVKAAVIARRLPVVFACLAGEIAPEQRRSFYQKIQFGVGDYTLSPKSDVAYKAYQLRSSWPVAAERYLWRGILRAAFEGDVLSITLFMDEFEAWQQTNKDSHCAELVKNYPLSMG
jgi:hypothetical protein